MSNNRLWPIAAVVIAAMFFADRHVDKFISRDGSIEKRDCTVVVNPVVHKYYKSVKDTIVFKDRLSVDTVYRNVDSAQIYNEYSKVFGMLTASKVYRDTVRLNNSAYVALDDSVTMNSIIRRKFVTSNVVKPGLIVGVGLGNNGFGVNAMYSKNNRLWYGLGVNTNATIEFKLLYKLK